MKLGKKEDSGKVIKEASAILNDIGNKTSETYALLALVQVVESSYDVDVHEEEIVGDEKYLVFYMLH